MTVSVLTNDFSPIVLRLFSNDNTAADKFESLRTLQMRKISFRHSRINIHHVIIKRNLTGWYFLRSCCHTDGQPAGIYLLYNPLGEIMTRCFSRLGYNIDNNWGNLFNKD